MSFAKPPLNSTLSPSPKLCVNSLFSLTAETLEYFFKLNAHLWNNSLPTVSRTQEILYFIEEQTCKASQSAWEFKLLTPPLNTIDAPRKASYSL